MSHAGWFAVGIVILAPLGAYRLAKLGELPLSALASGEFPRPPQLFDLRQMVTGDAQGIAYWKPSHGIRLSGMPGFGSTLPMPCDCR